jgi:AcrR family transcriptional regulator
MKRDPQATRKRILAAAIGEFAQHGLAGARGDRIAKAAQSSERMVYYYFDSKELLYRAALEKVYGDLRDAEQALALDGLEPVAAVAAFSRFVWRYYAQHPEFVSLLNTENLRQAQTLRTSEQLPELVAPIVKLLKNVVVRGQNTGKLRSDLDSVRLYVLIASLGYFAVSNQHTLSAVLGYRVAEPASMQALADDALSMVLAFVQPLAP